ncbi:MAG: glycosyltransferase family 2 protein [Lachnospiraceae bacterium]|nr:glycosyltransferase family 2 protein [Lachnospiraceae bacterium]
MQIATVVIPNLNGKKYLKDCLNALRAQSRQDFSVILIDNGSTDGSAEFVRETYPEVTVKRFEENRGFCGAVNEGIRMTKTKYVVLLNNDTIVYPAFLEELVSAMEHETNCFAGSSRMVQMQDSSKMDNCGDFYCALGWAFTPAKGKSAVLYDRGREVFSACAGAAIYLRRVFDEIGLFDEAHFAYLEDVDVCWRARIAGYRNLYVPDAIVRHVGSATSGSVYNEFKVRHSSRNSIYLIYKNMPLLQIVLNLPFLIVGFAVKFLFFVSKGLGGTYARGLIRGVKMCSRDRKVRFHWKNLRNYAKIQLELWLNLIRRVKDF